MKTENSGAQFLSRRELFTFALSAAILAPAMVLAEDTPPAKTSLKRGSMWARPGTDGKLSLVIAGRPEPLTLTVADETLFAGTCQNCFYALEFKAMIAALKSACCGADSNSGCIVGNSLKDNSWQGMIKGLPRGVALIPTFNTADKPESGVKRVVVDLRSVLLPVKGLEGQSADQIQALIKPLGATKVALIDANKHLAIDLKANWTAERQKSLEKALAGIGGKVLTAES